MREYRPQENKSQENCPAMLENKPAMQAGASPMQAPPLQAETAMQPAYLLVRDPAARQASECGGTFARKEEADRELDRLNAFRQPDTPEWRLLIRPIES